MRLYQQNRKARSLFIDKKILPKFQIYRFFHRSVLKTTSWFCNFSVKQFELHGIQFALTEFFHLQHRENYHLPNCRFYAAYKCEIAIDIKMCSSFDFDCRQFFKTFIGNMCCPKKNFVPRHSVSTNRLSQKKKVQSLAACSDITSCDTGARKDNKSR